MASREIMCGVCLNATILHITTPRQKNPLKSNPRYTASLMRLWWPTTPMCSICCATAVRPRTTIVYHIWHRLLRLTPLLWIKQGDAWKPTRHWWEIISLLQPTTITSGIQVPSVRALFSLKNVTLAVLPRKNMKNGLRIQFSCRKAGLLAIFTVMVLTLTKPMWWRKTGLCTMPSTKMGANIAPLAIQILSWRG